MFFQFEGIKIGQKADFYFAVLNQVCAQFIAPTLAY